MKTLSDLRRSLYLSRALCDDGSPTPRPNLRTAHLSSAA